MRKINKIVIHCTDSDDSLDIGFKEINQWHKERGWVSDSGINCGYHFIIRRNGTVEKGRPLSESGAHVKGHNKSSIGIVWVGRNQMSKEQKISLFAITKGLVNQFNLDIADDIYGHYELDKNKTCPNLDMVKFRAELLFA